VKLEIRDPIHGNIELNETVHKIINTPQMQRLRYIKQLDMTYLVFPGANNTRFEHSLGTMKVTKELVARIYGDKEEEWPYVGLLHDIGHGPFSHLSEPLIEKYLKKNHEQIGEERINNSEIKDMITDSGLSLSKITSYFKGADVDIVGGVLGSDRIDYLMRDSHYTGVAYGIIDYERLKSRLVLSKNRIAISEEGISAAESMLIARYFMHLNVYTHHTKTIANKMLLSAIAIALEQKVFDAKELSNMYDDQLISRLLNSKIKTVSELVDRIRERRLFKRAYYAKLDKEINIKELENVLSKAGFDSRDYVLRVIGLAGGRDDINVVDLTGKHIGKLTELSPLIKTLTGVLTDSKMLLVACDKKSTEKMGSVVRKFLG
jgi:uncharacterized protein